MYNLENVSYKKESILYPFANLQEEKVDLFFFE